jgi:hypothetical protein
MSPRDLDLMETVSLEIDEATEEDAPVAVTWTDREGNAQFTRWYNGRHFKLADTDYGANAEALIELLPPHGELPISGFTEGFMHYPDQTTLTTTHSRVESFNETRRQKALENAKEWADSCLIVDDEMYLACAEPHYRVYLNGLDIETNFGAHSKGEFWEHRPNTIGRGNWFHVERFDLLSRHEAVAMADAWYNVVVDDNAPASPNILLAASVGHCDGRPLLHEATDYLLKAIGNADFLTLPPAIIKGVLPIKELLWNRDINDIDHDMLAEAVEAGRIAIHLADQDMKICAKYDRQWLDEAMRRLFNAEISLDLKPTLGHKP